MRQKTMLAKRDATIALLRSQLASTIVGEELNKMRKKMQKMQQETRSEL